MSKKNLWQWTLCSFGAGVREKKDVRAVRVELEVGRWARV
jgi:hypothetical protein